MFFALLILLTVADLIYPDRESSELENKQLAQRPARSRGKKAEEDPGLLLISRRPPAQKFASFEEYIQSHGGVTAPIEGDGEE